jgi:hypothetical protein
MGPLSNWRHYKGLSCKFTNKNPDQGAEAF